MTCFWYNIISPCVAACGNVAFGHVVDGWCTVENGLVVVVLHFRFSCFVFRFSVLFVRFLEFSFAYFLYVPCSRTACASVLQL